MKIDKNKLPSKFLDDIKTEIGTEYDLFYEELAKKAPVSIRKNCKKYTELLFDKIELSPVLHHNNGFYLSERPSFTNDPLFHAGCYYVQEASSMFISHIINALNITTKDIVALDLCAAPGGKTTNLLDILSPNSFLVANEVIKNRSFVLRENCTKWGFENIAITSNDSKDFARLPDFFDLILIDAPCSGEGMFRKDPNSIAEWSEENVRLCSLRQQQIVANVLPSLKSNGILIYSTCTYNATENTQNVMQFIQNHSLELIDIEVPTEWNITQTQKGCFQFYPHKNKGEGFFCAVLRKKPTYEINKKHTKTSKLIFASKLETEILNNWVNKNATFDFIHVNENIHALKKYILVLSGNFFKFILFGCRNFNGKITKKPSHTCT